MPAQAYATTGRLSQLQGLCTDVQCSCCRPSRHRVITASSSPESPGIHRSSVLLINNQAGLPTVAHRPEPLSTRQQQSTVTMMGSKPSWANSTFVRTSLPMFGFVVICWFGLSQLVDSKLRIRSSVRGYDKVEEYDPIERMKRLATGPAVSSLEQELKTMQHEVDINNFTYKPVPRTDDDEE